MSEQIDEGLRSELQRQGVWVSSMQELYNWGRKNSICRCNSVLRVAPLK